MTNGKAAHYRDRKHKSAFNALCRPKPPTPTPPKQNTLEEDILACFEAVHQAELHEEGRRSYIEHIKNQEALKAEQKACQTLLKPAITK